MDMDQSGTHSKNQEPQAFVPPRHWIGPEELTAGYWSDATTQEKRSQEFYEKPVEWSEKMDKMDTAGIARRDFLTVMGASMALASFGCARRPVHKIIPYVVKPEEVTLGVANWYASTSKACSCGCGVLVKTREGRPIKLEGNPSHPVNSGFLCSAGQASVLSLYDPERLQKPIKGARNGGAKKELSWAQVDGEIKDKLLKARGKVRVLSGETNSEAQKALVGEFLASTGSTGHYQYSPLALEELSEAQRISYGEALTPRYFFDKADVVLSLGADFLGTWLSPVEHQVAWAKGRKLENQVPAQAKLSELICFESNLSLTGSNADRRFPVRPGDELKVALALINLIATHPSVQSYQASTVEADLGLASGTLAGIAQLLKAHAGKSLVVAGGLAASTADSLALQLAANYLNTVLGNEGKTVDGKVAYSPAQKGFSGVKALIAEMDAGKVGALVIYRSNPAYTLPKSAGFLDALAKVPTVILVSDREDETGLASDYVLPDHHYLENWGDHSPRKGLYSLQQPAIAPMYETRAFEDSLIAWTPSLAPKPVDSAAPAENERDWHHYLKNWWKAHLYKAGMMAGSFDQFWEGVLREGVFQTGSEGALSARPAKTTPSFPAFKAGSQDLVLALYAKNSMGDGSQANNSWLQELPDGISSVTWDNYLNVSPALAKKLALQEDEVFEVKTAEGSAELAVRIQPGLHPSVVSAAIGYGRRAAGKVGNGAGVDVFPLVQVGAGGLIYSGQKATLRRTGKYFKLASTQWHTASENRPIINDITLAQFRKNPAHANHTNPELRMEEVPSIWSKHEYKGYRWGMAIDLNSCTGCGSCVIACQAENNIPVVGRDQVRVSRQMHWIKIDRYYSGSPENPSVLFQPMLCQHCENAPCETVCPVLATVHDDEGLNVQVYNRCVGTRYCQNNCPYKVRRFNFFDHWKAYEGTLAKVFNPDVTVRTRGIMEKCTFCVQRIREAKDKAKDAGEMIADGDFKTACQQTCATDAIVFGNMNDPKSRVSRLMESPQAFRVLENLNAKPSISYMTKVRNVAAAGGEEHHA